MAETARITVLMRALGAVKDAVDSISGISPENVLILDWLPETLNRVRGFPAVQISPGEPFCTAQGTGDWDDELGEIDEFLDIHIELTLVTARESELFQADYQAHLALLDDIQLQVRNDIPTKFGPFVKRGDWLAATVRNVTATEGATDRATLIVTEWEIVIPTNGIDATERTDY